MAVGVAALSAFTVGASPQHTASSLTLQFFVLGTAQRPRHLPQRPNAKLSQLSRTGVHPAASTATPLNGSQPEPTGCLPRSPARQSPS